MPVSSLRAKLGVVMVVLVLVVCLVLLVRQRFFPAAPAESLTPIAPMANIPLTPIAPAELQAEWQTAVTAVLADYDQTGDARAAKERMLTIRVPASGRDVHLALYLAFHQLSESRPEGRANLASARATFQKGIIPVSTSSSTTP